MIYEQIKTATKVKFYNHIPAIQATVTQVFKNVPLDGIKESILKMFGK